MYRILKFITVFLLLFNFQTNLNSKPVPPGAGEGDVAANILFLVDSSASMGAWIGNDGLDAIPNSVFDSSGRMLVTQNRGQGLLRYNTDGTRDGSFRIRRANNCMVGVRENNSRVTSERVRRNVNRNHNVKFVEGLDAPGFTNENLIFFLTTDRRARHRVLAFNEAGNVCRLTMDLPNMGTIRGFDIKEINGVHYLFAFGRGWRGSAGFASCNLNTLQCVSQSFPRSNFAGLLNSFLRMAVNNEGTMVYLTNGSLSGYSLTASGAAFSINPTRQRLCQPTNSPTLSSEMISAAGLAVSPDDSNTVYIGSSINFAVQKLELTDTSCTVVTSVGKGIRNLTKNSPATGETTIDADDVNFGQVWSIDATSTRLLTATGSGYLDVFNEDNFTVANRDNAWLQNMGGPRMNRWMGVKMSIDAVVNDTTLTTGAHFGFGHWNAGESGRGKNSRRGGRFCHRNDGCTYYISWKGDHPDGRSFRCNSDSCLNVGISSKGASRIMTVLQPLGLAWGTDANAFSQLAEKYFNDSSAGGKAYDADSECQLNYVIVIGDGAMRNTGVRGQRGGAAAAIARLRAKGIKTLFVAYGDGIRGGSDLLFQDLARIGSCAEAGGSECEERIVALTPEDLKSELTSKIRQIIADKLAFTAPSITATIQEGGSLYQAQFAYEQHAEWRGTILRKKLNVDGTVEHDPTLTGNWSAAVQMKKQATAADQTDDNRNLWSAIPKIPYIGNWDNFIAANSNAIGDLFEKLNYNVKDYHNSNLGCKLGATGNSDDINGLINFMRGSDYFDYDGDCNINEVRAHVMGDVYHSQLVEVGPPKANFNYTDDNEEAYFRAKNNYQGFINKQANRKNIIYAGANSGILHAINAKTGKEEWGFIPPFVAGLIPQIINRGYNGTVDGSKGGSNPIFGVDGSPVVHDVFMRGINSQGKIESSRNWHTILFIPYGRGGSGFSVLDITEPLIKDGKGPLHMFSIYNDQTNSRILIADHEGNIEEKPYNSGFASSLQSLEGRRATDNYQEARDADEGTCADPDDCDVTTEQDLIATCVTEADFKDSGTASCFKGTTFYFDSLELDFENNEPIPSGVLSAREIKDGESKPIPIGSAMMENGLLKVTFSEEKTINAYESDAEPSIPNHFSISTSCKGATGIEPMYDYTQLGETWSAPRIFRIPNKTKAKRGDIDSDVYVAVMGGGLSLNDACAGSAVFLVDLEDRDNPGAIYGAEENGGPISIVDTDPLGITIGNTVIATPNGSDINNSIPTTPLTITPDSAFSIPWRGAMVYVNDHEGKITKINLTNSVKNDADLFDQTTLFRLNASTTNARYTYFSMDAGVGFTDKQFWLFGSTGNFTDLGGREPGMDNILYGIKDPDYPYFKHLNGYKLPSGTDPAFVQKAHLAANAADNIDSSDICKNVTADESGDRCPDIDEKAWYITLDRDESGNNYLPRVFRKASASPTLFSGKVYFPVYQPPPGTNKCNQGNAYVCATDDECGTNYSRALSAQNITATGTVGDTLDPTNNACAYVREGILSELVIFADKLYANVAGPSEDVSTLYSILSLPGDVMSNKGGWRDSSF